MARGRGRRDAPAAGRRDPEQPARRLELDAALDELKRRRARMHKIEDKAEATSKPRCEACALAAPAEVTEDEENAAKIAEANARAAAIEKANKMRATLAAAERARRTAETSANNALEKTRRLEKEVESMSARTADAPLRDAVTISRMVDTEERDAERMARHLGLKSSTFGHSRSHGGGAAQKPVGKGKTDVNSVVRGDLSKGTRTSTSRAPGASSGRSRCASVPGRTRRNAMPASISPGRGRARVVRQPSGTGQCETGAFVPSPEVGPRSRRHSRLGPPQSHVPSNGGPSGRRLLPQ